MPLSDDQQTAPLTVVERDPREGWGAAEQEAFGFASARPHGLPRFAKKYPERSVTSPEAFSTLPLERIPDVAILCYTKFATTALRDLTALREDSWESTVFPGLHYLNETLALVENTSLLGAPMATIQLERLIQLGVRNFIVLGIAGSLREGVEIGDVVVGDRAVRDEGTSYHYLPPSDYAWPSPTLTQRLAGHLSGHLAGIRRPLHLGGTWTTDAIFRETLLEVRALADEGILTVEMEASALFSVARFRGVEIAAAFVVSDLVHRPDWERGQEGGALQSAVSEALVRLASFELR